MAIEIVEVKSGTLECCVNNNVIMVYPGQMVFINSNIGHKLYSEHAEVFCYQIDISLLQENINAEQYSKLYSFISRTQAKPYLMLDNHNEITPLLHKISMKYYDETQESRWYIKGYLYELVAFLYSQSFVVPFMIPKEQFQKIEQVVHYIDANFQSPITLDEIGSLVKYNKYTVCHTFKAVTGSTIFEYINFLRVYSAAEKLKETENSVLEIATDCGFSSATYFNRVFKNFFGCSPSVYRKRLPTNGF